MKLDSTLVMITKDFNDKAKNERSHSYRMMFESWAWKDFEAFLDSERMSALELGINSSDIKDVQLNRGKVQQIDAIKSHLGYVISEQK